MDCESTSPLTVLRAIHARTNASPRRLSGPGPMPSQLQELLALAAAAPDHGRIVPWRFVLIPSDRRKLLADAFATALVERDASASEEEVARAAEKAYRAPCLMVAICKLSSGAKDVPDMERLVSLGAAIQNILLGARSMGFDSGLVSGAAMNSDPMRRLLQLSENEIAVSFIGMGTLDCPPKPPRRRPEVTEFFSYLEKLPQDC